MSFLEDIKPLLISDIETLLGLVGSVYFGSETKLVQRTKPEIWVEPVEQEVVSNGGFDKLRTHGFRVHSRERSQRGGDQAGEERQRNVSNRLETLRDSYQGSRRLASNLSNYRVLGISVTDPIFDEDLVDDENEYSASVLLTWYAEAA